MNTIGLLGGMSWESTEIAMLVQQHHTHVPLFDTTEIHAKEAVA